MANPADAIFFAGRQTELDAVADSAGRGLNCIVLGERGSGKSSLARQAAFALREAGMAHVFIVDGAAAPDALGTLQLVAESLVGPEYRTTHPTNSLQGTMERHFGRLEPLRSAAGELLRVINRLEDELLDPGSGNKDDAGLLSKPGARAVVILDGSSGSVAHTLFGSLRDEIWRLPLSWIVTGDSATRSKYLEPPADAFFEVRVELKPLSDEAATELIRRRVGHTTADQDVTLGQLVAMTDRQPRSLVSVARKNLASVRSGNTSQLDQAGHARADIDDQIAALGTSAVMLVAELRARGGAASASDAGVLASLEWTRSRAVQVLRKLEDAGIVTASLKAGTGTGRPRKVYELVEAAR